MNQFKQKYSWVFDFKKHLTIFPPIPNLVSSKFESSYSKYTFSFSLPENMLSLTPTSNSLTQKGIHFIRLTFINSSVTINIFRIESDIH